MDERWSLYIPFGDRAPPDGPQSCRLLARTCDVTFRSSFSIRHLLLLSLAKFLHASSQDVTNVNRTILPDGDVVSPKQLTVVVSK
jgi:hypothetical protein